MDLVHALEGWWRTPMCIISCGELFPLKFYTRLANCCLDILQVAKSGLQLALPGHAVGCDASDG